jgi:hypothetical protein
MPRRRLAPAAAALAVVLLSACGGGGDDDGGVASLGDGDGEEASTDTTLSDEEAQVALIDWAECMRGHGLDVPDPQLDEDGGVQIMVGSGMGGGGGDEGDDGGGAPPDRAAFEAAREECGDPPQIGGEFSEEDREEMEENALAFAECMRDNGVEDFPDPDFSQDGPGAGPLTRERSTEEDEPTSGEGAVIAGPFGQVDLSDPEQETAFEACQDELGERFGPPPVAAERG